MKVFLLTDCPSPYQVEFFNEIEAQGECALEVGYLRSRDPSRQWSAPAIRHSHFELDGPTPDLSRALNAGRRADFVVFNYYLNAHAERLIAERSASGGPWCFWGERPGFHQLAWAGRLFRKWKLAPLHTSEAPIWGIGKFAIDGYRREFGTRRAYFNLPYFSDLERFRFADRKERAKRVFLFCGSLIERKGVDLLAQAFVRLAREFEHVSLRIVGEGRLRESLARVLGPVSERVEFAGFKDWSDLPSEYANADVLCVPSRYDGWGLVVPEGLASGLPVIATERTGAALEFVEDGRNGWLIRAGDEESLMVAMRQAAAAPLTAMGQHARASVSQHSLANGAGLFTRFVRESATSSKNLVNPVKQPFHV